VIVYIDESGGNHLAARVDYFFARHRVEPAYLCYAVAFNSNACASARSPAAVNDEGAYDHSRFYLRPPVGRNVTQGWQSAECND
jgi:hypothetical protein